MARVERGTELVVSLGNRIGAGAEVFGGLKDAGINVIASSGIQLDDEVTFSIIPDRLEAAMEVMAGMGLKPESRPVLLVQMPNKPGALADLLREIAAMGVNVRSAYATTSTQQAALAVLMTDDDDKVVRELSGWEG